MGDSTAQRIAYLLLNSAVLGSIFSIPEFFQRNKLVHVAEVNQRHCLEESGQWLENVDRTHQVPYSGELVIQKELPG